MEGSLAYRCFNAYILWPSNFSSRILSYKYICATVKWCLYKVIDCNSITAKYLKCFEYPSIDWLNILLWIQISHMEFQNLKSFENPLFLLIFTAKTDLKWHEVLIVSQHSYQSYTSLLFTNIVLPSLFMLLLFCQLEFNIPVKTSENWRYSCK